MALSAERIVTEWNLRTGQSVKDIDELNRAIVRAQREEKKLKRGREELDRVNELLSKRNKALRNSMSGLSSMGRDVKSSLFGQLTAANLASQAITRLAGALGEIGSNAAKYNQVAAAFKGDLEGARAATQGFVSDLDLMTARNQLNILGVKLSDEAFNDLLGSLVKVSQAMGQDMKYSLESATLAMSRQSKMIADNVGVTMDITRANENFAASIGKNVKELTDQEKKLAFQQEFITQLTDKASQLPEAFDAASKSWSSFSTVLGNSLTTIWADLDRRLGHVLDKTADLIANIRTMGAYGRSKAGEQARADKEFRGELDLEAAELGFAGQAGGATAAGGYGGLEDDSFYQMYGKGVLINSFDETGGRTGAGLKHIKKPKPKRSKNKKPKPISLTSITGVHSGQLTATDSMAGAYTDMEKMFSDIDKLNELTNAEPWRAAADGFAEIALNSQMAVDSALGADRALAGVGANMAARFNEAKGAAGEMRTATEGMAIASDEMKASMIDGFASFAGGLWDAAAQAIESGENFGLIAVKMLKQVTLGLASQLMARGVAAMLTGQAMAMNPATAPAAPFWIAQGKAFMAYSGIVGAMGLGLTAATSGGGGGSPAASVAGRMPSEQSQGYRPQSQTSFAAKKSVEAQPIYVQLYLGDPSNPSTALLAKKQVTVLVNQANQGYSEA